MLSTIEDVSESDVLQKQGGETDTKENPTKKIVEPTDEIEQKPNIKDQKDNEASASKYKGKLVMMKKGKYYLKVKS